MNENDNVIIGIFETRESADQAIQALKDWDHAHDDITLGDVGLLYMEDGELKSNMGHRTGGGATVGAVVGVIAGVLTGGIGLVAGLAGGALLGGVMGRFFKKSADLSEAEANRIAKELEGGKFAIIVNLDDYEITPATSVMAFHDGDVYTYNVSQDAVEELTKTSDD